VGQANLNVLRTRAGTTRKNPQPIPQSAEFCNYGTVETSRNSVIAKIKVPEYGLLVESRRVFWQLM